MRPIPFMSRKEKREILILSAVCIAGWVIVFGMAINDLCR
jgi:hypothetical protein